MLMTAVELSSYDNPVFNSAKGENMDNIYQNSSIIQRGEKQIGKLSSEETTKIIQSRNRRCSSFRLLLVSVGILSVLLLTSIGIICWAGWKMNQQDEAAADLGKQTERLKSENEKLQNETENLNQTIQLIRKFNTFPIDEHCDSGKCLLCQKGWLFFNESCYFISNILLTWNDSRVFCQYSSADLVVIDSEQEQRFIYDNINTNYWLGLRKVGSDWVWIDGRINTLRFWFGSYPNSSHSYAKAYRSGNPTASWITITDPSPNVHISKPICERKAFRVSSN